MKTAYELLHVDRGATLEEVSASYRELAKTGHPDITAAYATLKNAARRAEYDKELLMLHGPCPDCGGEGRRYKQKGFTVRVHMVCAGCKGSGIDLR